MNKLIQKMNELMVTTRKHHIRMKDDGTYWETYNITLKDKVLEQHINGTETIGVFSGQYVTKYICFDIDTKQHAEGDTRHLVNVLVNDFNISRKDIHLSLSGSKGIHAELYLDKCISYNMAQRFYKDVLDKADFTIKQVELRPQPEQGLKLPLGINRKTGNRCWYLNQDTYEPIKNFEHILSIEPMSSEFFEIEYAGYEPISLNTEQVKQFNHTAQEVNINTAEIEGILGYVKDILKLGHIKQSGTRNNMTLGLAIYLKEYYGLDQEQATKDITQIMLNSKKNNTVSSTEQFIIKETARIVNVVYKYDYKLTKRNKDVEIYKQEILDLLAIKERHLKVIYFIHLVQSKRYAKANGHYFITYDTMYAMGAPKNNKNVAKYIKELELRGYLEVIQRKVWDVDRITTENKAVYKPNVYKVKKIVTPESDIDSITIKDNQELSLDKLLKEFADNFNDIDLKSYLPRKQLERVKKAV